MTEASPEPPPLLVVISGPSGVGKDAVMAGALERDRRLRRSITMTTREPRPHEVDGMHYDFATREGFERAVASGELLEHALVHGNCYGSPRSRVRALLEAGHDVLLQVDVQGSLALREVLPGALFVYIAPDDATHLEQRIRERGSGDDVVAARAEDRARELAAREAFEHVLVNRHGHVEDTIDAFLALVERERARPGRERVAL